MTPLSDTTRNHSLQWRAFVGPQFRRDDAADFFDWSALTYGAAYNPVPVATTLSTALAAGDNHAHLTTTTNFPAGGGVWVGPVWEYVSYAGATGGQLANLTREATDSEQTGNHANGATVYFWYPLTPTDGTLTLSDDMDPTLSVLAWQARLQGVNIPQAMLRNGHLLLIQTRFALAGDSAYSAWTNALVGWLQSPQARQDGTTVSAWQVSVVSSASLLNNIQAQGLRVGAPNSAVGGAASGSTALSAWYKAAYTGEFVGTPTALEPAQAVDGNPSTLYASERFLGTVNEPGTGIYELDQIHISPYTGQGRGYRWVQIIWNDLATIATRVRLVNHKGYSPDILPTSLPNAGHLLVFCENETQFHAENPECTAQVMEVSDATTTMGFVNGDIGIAVLQSAGAYTVANWWDDLAPVGGALYYAANFGGTFRFQHGVLWGNVNRTTVSTNWGSPRGAEWVGSNVAAVGVGQTMRRIWPVAWNATPNSSAWAVSYVSTPGAKTKGTERLHILIGAAGMGLTLTNPITVSSPDTGGTLYLSLGDAACVDGLDASGTVQIGTEQITYSAKNAANSGLTITARGANSTAKAIHNAGETVYQLESSLATDALPLAAITLQRATGMPAIKAFKLYGSRNLQTPRVPTVEVDPIEDAQWALDYDLLATLTTNTSLSYTYTHSATPKRYKWFLLVATAMNTEPYRLMLNECKIQITGSVYSANTYLASGTVYQAAQAILRGCGIPDNAIVDGGSTPTVTDYTTAPDPALGVLADLADMTRCLISVGRDSKITITPHTYLGASTSSDAFTWTKTNATAFAPDWAWGRQVSQVALDWLSLDGTTSGTVYYPTAPDAFGEVLRFGPLRAVDAAAALVAATKRYLLARFPFGMTVEAAGAPWAARPGLAENVTWQLDPAMNAMSRTYYINSVDHRLHDFQLTTVIHGVQVGREDEK
jgi:hypothetical protein